MALIHRSDGIAGGLVDSTWWNTYYDLVTGTMADQPVKINNLIETKGLAAPTGTPTSLALAAGAGLSIGAYVYSIGYTMGDGEQPPTTTNTITTTTGNQQIVVGLPLGPTGTTSRKIWRTKVGAPGTYYFVTQINDNTTTTYTDSTADASLTVGPPALTHFGGGLVVMDSNSNKNLIVSPAGDFLSSGKWGRVTNADIIDASTAGILYIKTNSGAGTIVFQFPNGTDSFRFISNAIEVPSWLGVRTIAGTKLAEFKGNGNFIISGSQYQTSGGAISTSTGGSFDSFDVGEVFECDKEYPNGTVVCPGQDDTLTQCAHDNCPCALLISHNPGLGLGVNDHPSGIHYVAMAGRVNARTAQDLHKRTFVVSDGRGGVRAAKPGEGAFVVGFTLNETAVIDSHAVVGVYIRPMFLTFRSS